MYGPFLASLSHMGKHKVSSFSRNEKNKSVAADFKRALLCTMILEFKLERDLFPSSLNSPHRIS